MRFLVSAVAALCGTGVPAMAQANFCAQIDGAIIVSDSGDYLGKITNKFASDSIFNEFGTFGSKYQTKSIWNEYGENGSPYNANSWKNKFSSSPPKIVKNGAVIAILTVNKSIQGAINPILIGVMCYDFEPS